MWRKLSCISLLDPTCHLSTLLSMGRKCTVSPANHNGMVDRLMTVIRSVQTLLIWHSGLQMGAAEAHSDQGGQDLWTVVNRARKRKTKWPTTSQSVRATFGTDYPGERMCPINFSLKISDNNVCLQWKQEGSVWCGCGEQKTTSYWQWLGQLQKILLAKEEEKKKSSSILQNWQATHSDHRDNISTFGLS